MKIISFNVNGIRAAFNKDFASWLGFANPDVICLQEIKAQVDQIDVSSFENLSYHTYWHPAKRKGYSGVGIATKIKPKNVVYGIGIDYIDDEGRIIRADYDNYSVISVYVPSASNIDRLGFKLKFCDDFLSYLENLQKTIPNLIVCGDFNICHEAIDIHDPVRLKNTSGFLPVEREFLTKFLKEGHFTDSYRYLHPDTVGYSWWSYRGRAKEKNLGWRLDYCMVSNVIKEKMNRALMLPEVSQSDHCPIVLEMSI